MARKGLNHKVRQSGVFRGLPVHDAKEALVFRVHQYDVEFAVKKKGNACAAARSICNKYHLSEVYVHTSVTYVRRGNVFIKYRTPGSLAFQIKLFDVAKIFSIGEFYLAPPVPSRRQGIETRREKATPRRDSFREFVPRHVFRDGRGRPVNQLG